MNRPARSAPPPLRLQDAKTHFSAVVDAAMRGQPQHVTKRGKPAVVIVGADEFERLSRADHEAAPSFVEHLLAVPKPPKGERPRIGSPRASVRLRDLDLPS
ncbi:MAG: type II toxin-antitoxin system Phd/YefM family antitoxin [Caldimonas sp.]